jgi:uncharacterized heparinase superfamily protein
VLRRSVPAHKLSDNLQCQRWVLAPTPPPSRVRVFDRRFLFINEFAPWSIDDIDWKSSSKNKLWRYNLHYFDWLKESETCPGDWRRTVNHWITTTQYGDGDGWEPYPLSLRIVNWIKWMWQSEIEPDPTIVSSLYQQGKALESQLEFHIQANHLYKNAVALVFLGAFFGGKIGNRWRQIGLRIFLRETRRQFLQDGGHVERSPLYHSICLEDLLDVINVLKSINYEGDLPELSRIAESAVSWMLCMTDQQGELLLFNDSAYGIAPTPCSLRRYAESLGISVAADGDATRHLIDSGYMIYSNARTRLVFDCNNIGPGFQPGHTHCDMLSFVLWRDGRPLLIDAGVSSYMDDENRRYARSTAAHNTLTIDDRDQSELWSAFRVGRRARIVDTVFKHVAGQTLFSASHNGFARFWKDCLHSRSVRMAGDQIVIADTVSGESGQTHEVCLYFHFACHHRVVIENDYCEIHCKESGSLVAQLSIEEGWVASVAEKPFYPEFGITRAHPVVMISGQRTFPFSIQTILTLAG